MGATTFSTHGLGKTPSAAFAHARERALYDYGHAGYTGTIAEKPGYVLFIIPKGVRCSATKFIQLVGEAEEFNEGEWHRSELQWAKTAAEKRKIEAAIKKAERKKASWWKKINPQLAEAVKQAVPVYQQKWEDCVAVEVTGADAARIKAYHGRKGTHDKVYLFAGWASC